MSEVQQYHDNGEVQQYHDNGTKESRDMIVFNPRYHRSPDGIIEALAGDVIAYAI